MSVKIWIETEHQPVYRAGGFAWLRHGAEGLSGAAGGFRDVDAEDLAARSLLSAVKGLPPGEAVALHLSEARLIEGVRQLGALASDYSISDEQNPVSAPGARPRA